MFLSPRILKIENITTLLFVMFTFTLRAMSLFVSVTKLPWRVHWDFSSYFWLIFSHIEALKSDTEGCYMYLESKCKVQIPHSYYIGIWIVSVLQPDGKFEKDWYPWSMFIKITWIVCKRDSLVKLCFSIEKLSTSDN